MVKRIVLVLSFVGVLGCATTVWWQTLSKTYSRTRSVGMTKDQAQALLGPPQAVMTQRLGDLLIETWKYLDKTLTFHNGLLWSWQSGTTDQGDSTP